MGEHKKSEVKSVDSQPVKKDYYTRTGLKVFDFFIGFVGSLIVLIISVQLSFSGSEFGIWFGQVFNYYILILLFVVTCIFSFRYGRRFIGIGIITLGIVPLIIFGSCLMLLVR